MEADIFKLKLDPKAPELLQKQIYGQLRDLILSGELLPGVRLPASRKLAELIGVSRKTVVNAYDQLLAEGYLSSQTGSGTFVTDPAQPQQSQTQPTASELLSVFARRLSATETQSQRLEHVRFPFFNWQPAFDELPLTDWSRIVAKTFRKLDPRLLDYASDPLGHLPLRAAIADRLLRTRGLSCQPEQVVINCGLSQSLDLMAKLHAEEGMELLVENPSYRPIRDVFRTYGAQIRSIDVDQGGVKTERLAKLSRHNIKVIYVTPSHQFPTGAVLSLARRLELIKWATECGALIIEDDFDSEFRYKGSPIPAMKTLDKEEQVLYLSSFTKIFYPSLAIAFMVLPPKLIPVYTKARWLAADNISVQIQDALAEFISTGLLDRHAKRMRTTYAHRRRALLEAVEDHLNDCATTYGDHAGLSTLIRIKSDLEDDEILRRAMARGLALTSTRTSYTRSAVRGEFILGYGNMSESQIRQGIIELRMIVRGK
jgi:GntR family transcriptional regulator/MocR family aminotransferase